jgi:hypothetical protein
MIGAQANICDGSRAAALDRGRRGTIPAAATKWLAHPEGAESNKLFEILADWNAVLQDTSLADDPPAEFD